MMDVEISYFWGWGVKPWCWGCQDRINSNEIITVFSIAYERIATLDSKEPGLSMDDDDNNKCDMEIFIDNSVSKLEQ